MSNDAMRDALEQIKDLVSSPKNSWRWITNEGSVIWRGVIEDLCSAALAAPSAAPAQPVAWTARWHGSNPERGWSIYAGRDCIAYIGGDEGMSEAISEIVAAHNKCFDCDGGPCVMNCSGRASRISDATKGGEANPDAQSEAKPVGYVTQTAARDHLQKTENDQYHVGLCVSHKRYNDTDVAVFFGTPAQSGAKPVAWTSQIQLDQMRRDDGQETSEMHPAPGEINCTDCDGLPYHEKIDIPLYTSPSASPTPPVSAQSGETAKEFLDFTPDENHTIADMANVGYALMQAIKTHRPGYCWNESPSEIVGDLLCEIEEATDVQHTHRFTIDPSSDEPRCVVCGCEPESAPAGDGGKRIRFIDRAIVQEERACRVEDMLIDLVNQIRKTSPVDDHGHSTTMNAAYLKAVKYLDDAARHAPAGADVLSDEEIVATAAPYCDDSGWMNGDQIFAFARAILAKRGGA